MTPHQGALIRVPNCVCFVNTVQLNDTVVADITTESANLRFVCTSTEDTMLRISLKPTQNSTIGEQSKTTTCQSENKEVSFDHLMSSTEYIIRASVQKEFNNQILLVCGNLYRENFNTKCKQSNINFNLSRTSLLTII